MKKEESDTLKEKDLVVIKIRRWSQEESFKEKDHSKETKTVFNIL